MTAPTFVTESESAWNTTTSPKTSGSLSVQAGDVLLDCITDENYTTAENYTTTNSGTAQTWTERRPALTNNGDCSVQIHHAISSVTASMTVTATRTAGDAGDMFGHNVLQYRDSGGIGNTANSGTAQSVSITVSDESSIVAIVADWSAAPWGATTRPWLAAGGLPTPTEMSYFTSGVDYTTGIARWENVPAGTYTVGLTGLSGTFSIQAVEVLGTSGGSTTTGTLSASVPRAASSITGTVTAPTWTGTLSAATPTATASIAGTVTAPVYAGSVSAATPLVTSSVSGSVAVPTYAGTVTASTAVVTGSVTGTVTAPTYAGTVSASTPKTTGSMSGTVTPPTYTGTLTAAIPPTASAITGTVTNPAGSATLSVTVPRVTASMSGTFTAPVWTGTLAGQLARTTATMLGTVSAPAYVGALGATLPKVTGSASGTVLAPVFSGVLAGTLPVLVGALAGVVVADPDYVPPVLEVGPATPARFTAAAAREAGIGVAVPSRRLAAGPARPHRYGRQSSR